MKPSNIMIDQLGEPLLMDFGLAKREANEVTMTVDGQILGTPAYMSLEHAGGRGHWTDRRTDIYLRGVILFELLTSARASADFAARKSALRRGDRGADGDSDGYDFLL